MLIKDIVKLTGFAALWLGTSGCRFGQSSEQECLKILAKGTHQACLTLDGAEWAGGVADHHGGEVVLWLYGQNGDGTQKSVFAGHGAIASDGSVRFTDQTGDEATVDDTLFLQVGILGCVPTDRLKDGMLLFVCQQMIDPPSDDSQNTRILGLNMI